jgi:hypothetical protein
LLAANRDRPGLENVDPARKKLIVIIVIITTSESGGWIRAASVNSSSISLSIIIIIIIHGKVGAHSSRVIVIIMAGRRSLHRYRRLRLSPSLPAAEARCAGDEAVAVGGQ